MFMTAKLKNGVFLIEESEFFALKGKFPVRTKKDAVGKFLWM